MTDIQIIAFTRAVRAYAEIEGMKAENKQREIQGESMAYTVDAFYNVIEENLLSEEEVRKWLNW